MKKIVFLIMCITFSMSVNAHQPTTHFNNQVASTAFAMESTQMYTDAYAAGNGGILQLIYNVFYKMGSMISIMPTNDETPKEEEITTEN